ncbi:MAG: hypothetical protein ACT4PL_12190, partial [Phycisphaerales bacterium]
MPGSGRSSKSRYRAFAARFKETHGRSAPPATGAAPVDAPRTAEPAPRRDWTQDPGPSGKRRAHRSAATLLRAFLGLLRHDRARIGLALCTLTISTML